MSIARLVKGGGILLALGVSLAIPATAAGATEATWHNTPDVSCDTIVIDPSSWIKVTFVGTVNGVPFSESAMYNGDGSHNAHIAIGNLTDGNEHAHIVVTASSNFGFGQVTSETADVTLNCASIHTEGSTTLPRHDPGDGGTQTTVAAVSAGGPPSSGSLPFTGTDAGRITFIGCAALATGFVASRARSRRRRRAPVSRGLSNYD